MDANWLACRSSWVDGPTDTTAWYFGEDHETYCALRDAAPSALTWGEAGQRMNAIADRAASAFVNIDQGFDIFDREWWECRNIAERGPYSTRFMADCCRLILFNEATAEGGRHMFIVEQSDLADVLEQSARDAGLPVRRVGPRRVSRMLDAGQAAVRRAAGYFRAAGRQLIQAQRLRQLRKRNPLSLDRLAECDILFAAWTKAGDFPEDAPREIAHSMGYLPKVFRDLGFKVGYIALPLIEISDPDAIVQNVLNMSEAAILPDDALGSRKIIAAVVRALIPRARPKSDVTINGHKIDRLARSVLHHERFDWRATNAMLWSEIGPYLAKIGCAPKAIFHVYENQTWEKGLRHGLRRALPETRIIGCHQSPMSALYPNMLPAISEITGGNWPDVVLTHGASGRRRLINAGASPEQVIDGGLFRHGAFLVKRGVARKADQAARIICATGPGYQECLELTRKAAAAAHGRPDLALIINFHPLTTGAFRDRIRAFLERRNLLGANISFSDEPISKLLSETAEAVLYADTNSGFEAVTSGARAINVGRDHSLSADKLPDGISQRVYSMSEIRVAIDAGTKPTPATIEAALSDTFSTFDIDSVLDAASLVAKNRQPTISEIKKVIEP